MYCCILHSWFELFYGKTENPPLCIFAIDVYSHLVHEDLVDPVLMFAGFGHLKCCHAAAFVHMHTDVFDGIWGLLCVLGTVWKILDYISVDYLFLVRLCIIFVFLLRCHHFWVIVFCIWDSQHLRLFCRPSMVSGILNFYTFSTSQTWRIAVN